jgi:hypothetical protein
MEIVCFVVGAAVGYAVSRLTYRHACRAVASARRERLPAPPLPRHVPVAPDPEPVVLPFPRPELRVYRGE